MSLFVHVLFYKLWFSFTFLNETTHGPLLSHVFSIELNSQSVLERRKRSWSGKLFYSVMRKITRSSFQLERLN